LYYEALAVVSTDLQRLAHARVILFGHAHRAHFGGSAGATMTRRHACLLHGDSLVGIANEQTSLRITDGFTGAGFCANRAGTSRAGGWRSARSRGGTSLADVAVGRSIAAASRRTAVGWPSARPWPAAISGNRHADRGVSRSLDTVHRRAGGSARHAAVSAGESRESLAHVPNLQRTQNSASAAAKSLGAATRRDEEES
jgi:hypothetical protein